MKPNSNFPTHRGGERAKILRALKAGFRALGCVGGYLLVVPEIMWWSEFPTSQPQSIMEGEGHLSQFQAPLLLALVCIPPSMIRLGPHPIVCPFHFTTILLTHSTTFVCTWNLERNLPAISLHFCCTWRTWSLGWISYFYFYFIFL